MSYCMWRWLDPMASNQIAWICNLWLDPITCDQIFWSRDLGTLTGHIFKRFVYGNSIDRKWKSLTSTTPFTAKTQLVGQITISCPNHYHYPHHCWNSSDEPITVEQHLVERHATINPTLIWCRFDAKEGVGSG